jgi:HPt (histidine-containing phosphotransfer) domain-containing protein
MQVLAGLRELGGDDDPGLLLEVIGMFLEDAPLRMREIEQGLKGGDIKLLERAAHSLKSASANVGAVGLSGLCKRMEEIARTNSTQGIPELLAESGRAWAAAESALRAIRS